MDNNHEEKPFDNAAGSNALPLKAAAPARSCTRRAATAPFLPAIQ